MVDLLSSMLKVLDLIQHIKLGMTAHTCSHRLLEDEAGLEIQGHPQLNSQFEANLGSRRITIIIIVIIMRRRKKQI